MKIIQLIVLFGLVLGLSASDTTEVKDYITSLFTTTNPHPMHHQATYEEAYESSHQAPYAPHATPYASSYPTPYAASYPTPYTTSYSGSYATPPAPHVSTTGSVQIGGIAGIRHSGYANIFNRWGFPSTFGSPNSFRRVMNSDMCMLPRVYGSCGDSLRRWSYHPRRGRCISFEYSGCGGNANNFRSRRACERFADTYCNLDTLSIDVRRSVYRLRQVCRRYRIGCRTCRRVRGSSHRNRFRCRNSFAPSHVCLRHAKPRCKRYVKRYCARRVKGCRVCKRKCSKKRGCRRWRCRRRKHCTNDQALEKPTCVKRRKLR